MKPKLFLGIIDLCEVGEIELLSSEVLLYEVNRTPKPIRREFALEVLSKASKFLKLNDSIEQRARNFGEIGMKALDALHLASAEEAKADYFCTCDDQFLKKAKAISDLRLKAVSPIELIEVLEDGS